MRYQRLAVVSILLFASACATTPTAPAPAPATTSAPAVRSLTVMLYPWIPDAADDNFRTLAGYIKTQFQAQHPDITLNIVMSQTCPYCNTYSAAVQRDIFTSATPIVLNAVELDTINLGGLVANGYVPPITFAQDNQFPFAAVSSSVGGRAYAIPTLVCNYFYYGPQSTAEATETQRELATAAPTLAGRLNGAWDGSWTLSSLYLTAVANQKGYAAVPAAITNDIDKNVAAQLTAVMRQCSVSGANPCLNGTYGTGVAGLPQQQYVQGLYATTSGFSENSFYISHAGGKMPSVIEPLLLSYLGANRPLAFTDALVINARACTGQCVQDVYAFARFYNSDRIRNYISFSQDKSGAPPRRTSQAISSFWAQGVVSADPWYQRFKAGFAMSQAYPNQGLQQNRDRLYTQLCTYLKANGIPDACRVGSPPEADDARPSLRQ